MKTMRLGRTGLEVSRIGFGSIPIQRLTEAEAIRVVHRCLELGVRVGETLLNQASDRNADLIVMGCYGHSRVRELMLGGATRTMLQSMPIPVLMSH